MARWKTCILHERHKRSQITLQQQHMHEDTTWNLLNIAWAHFNFHYFFHYIIFNEMSHKICYFFFIAMHFRIITKFIVVDVHDLMFRVHVTLWDCGRYYVMHPNFSFQPSNGISVRNSASFWNFENTHGQFSVAVLPENKMFSNNGARKSKFSAIFSINWPMSRTRTSLAGLAATILREIFPVYLICGP